MANLFAPAGFQESRRYDGAAPNYAMETNRIAYNNTNKIAFGDPVKRLSSGYIDLYTAGTSTIHGIFAGCEYWDPTQQKYLYLNNWPAPTSLNSGLTVKCRISSDPTLRFRVQVSGGPAVQAAVGQNIEILSGTSGVPGAAGISTCAVDYTTLATTATLPFRVLDILTVGPNYLYNNTAANNYVEVMLNTSDYRSQTGI